VACYLSRQSRLAPFGTAPGQPSDWAPDGSGVLCTLGGYATTGVANSAALVSREEDVLWSYDPSTDGLVLSGVYKKFSRDGTTVCSWGWHTEGTEQGIWAIPVHGGAPSLVVAFDDPELYADTGVTPTAPHVDSLPVAPA